MAFLAIHSINSYPAHWHLNAGLEIITLLLIPYRYWGALLVGEAIPNAYEAWLCLADFGSTWVALRMIPEMLLCMPVVWLYRSKLNIFPTKHLVNIKALLTCVLIISIVLSAYSCALVSTLHITNGPYRHSPMLAGIYLAGNYAGLLTLVPCALIVRLDFRKGRFHERLKEIWSSSKLLADASGLALPVIAFMAWIAGKSEMTQATVIEMAMLIPAAWLTVRHGWRAAALAGTLIIICNGLLQPDLPTTSNVVEITFALCLAVSGLYALGAKVTAQNLRNERERQGVEAEQQMVRQNLAVTERRMRRAAEKLEFVAGSLHIANNRVLDHMRRIVPNIESHAFYKQAMVAHEQVYQLAESLHPSAWRDRGVPAALNETVARALDEAGIAYSCHIGGRGFTLLESSVMTAIYRTACEAITHVTSHLTCSRVRLEVRAGETNKHRWAVIRVDGLMDHDDVARSVYYSEQRRDLGVKLGAHLASIEEMRSQAQVFGGQVHVRATSKHLRVTALLHSQAAEVRQQKASAPLRLWVN
ncbi:MASE1 domain-containing protein [Dyella flava]|uniref:MASE1 domain-containing protein n=1 Tax=Dyella flava TaxID=1920170 RepID=A0ABS2K6P2_9GAMM|nr:MASE1 domain-containing protein [Dyella flava]MBM7126559.1 MASE1 domain-containing protein [Dyella flava]